MATSRMTSASSKAKKSSGKRRATKATPKNPSPTQGAAVKAPKPATRSRKSVPSKSASKSSTAKKVSVAKKAAVSKRPAAKKAPAPKKTVAAKRVTKSATAKKAAPNKKSAVKKPAAKKVIKSKLPKKFVAEMKAQLVAERAKYLQTAEDMRAEADSLFDDREPGDVQFDEESGEGDTLSVERERGLALSTQAQSAVLQIDEALDRIAAGTYGICVVSGESIPKERLEAIPWAAMTVRHKVGGLSRR